MSPYVLATLTLTLILGTTVTLASSHWVVAWMGLEVTTLAVIPIIAHPYHPLTTEAATKYFLIQATAAAVLLFATTTNAWMEGQWHTTQLTHPLASTMALMALAMKMGLAPLHLWLPEVIQGVTLPVGLLLSTWQKLAPLALVLQVAPNAHPHALTTLGILSTLAGGWGGLNQTQLRKVLAYSSVAHLGWTVIVVQMAPQMALLAFFTYVIMTTATFLTLWTTQSTTIIKLASAWTKTPPLAPLSCLLLLSLGGLPPLTGFMPKWLILQELAAQGLFALATTLAMSALLSLFFYLRLTYLMALTLSPHPNNATAPWRSKAHRPTALLPLTISLALLGLPLTPTITSLL
uniref:NADH-ubiquinone oxidoreductase chain 2 n=1 Tax=Chirocentrus dorab TaxID=221863 RepID=A0A679BBH6_9TELE|nr:NADH dehydrogenase subunit 2 [Chirocentrus dorab]